MENLPEQQLPETTEESCCHSNLDNKRKSHHSEADKKSLISRLNRVEGQVRGVKRLIEEDTYCDDVLTQIAAIQSALNSVGKLLLEGHMKSCVVERIQEGDKVVIDELLVTVKRLMK
ncbi:metal-sensitive transcriptional regulator [Bacillus sp. FJAT-45066]|uniref:metal-sensitive transcriptional regulator n=1 Tax=Bacillus sp. FJAT-45066 TaxID=2011010 RepID=UPI000BB71F03|nr:metal-sensitive transcriptional regulator [Bacillus sp. FJAT-45066]